VTENGRGNGSGSGIEGIHGQSIRTAIDLPTDEIVSLTIGLEMTSRTLVAISDIPI
jgi:hypothetical protein